MTTRDKGITLPYASAFTSVKDPAYGAKGDGVTDDTSAIVAALAASGGTVFFPPGTYKIASPITLPQNAHLLGFSSEAAILKFTGATTLFTTTAGGFTHFEKLGIYGNPTAPAYFTAGTKAVTINDQFTARDCQFRYFEIALNWVANGFYLKYWNCQFVFNRIACYNMNANNTDFFGCRFGYSDSFVQIGGFDGPINFHGCSFENVTQSAITLINGAQSAVNVFGGYVENVGALSVVGTGLNAAGFKAATFIQGAFKSVGLFGVPGQIAGFFRVVDCSSATGCLIIGKANHWIYKLDGGLSDTQYIYLPGTNGIIDVTDTSEGRSDISYTPAATYTIQGTLLNSYARASGSDPISQAALEFNSFAAYTPGAITAASGVTTTVAVSGAVVGDYVAVSFSNDLQGVTLTGYVSAANVVTARFQNGTGATVTLAAGTLRARIIRK
jgi:Pectate lyase superfamily protein